MSTVTELITSRGYASNEGKPRSSRTYKVVGAATEADVIALFGSTLPAENELYPSSALLPYDMEFFDFDIAKDSGTNEVWIVTCRYKARPVTVTERENPTTTQLQPNEIGYRSYEMSMMAEFEDGYRKFSTLADLTTAISTLAPNGNTTLAAAMTDIGGESNDIAGRPTSMEGGTQDFTITITDRKIPDPQMLFDQKGTRNHAIFLGFPAGSVAFLGCQLSVIPEVGRNSIRYMFAMSSVYHLIQYPLQANNGTVPLNLTTAGTLLAGTAKTVLWRQPFARMTDFSLLSQYFTGL